MDISFYIIIILLVLIVFAFYMIYRELSKQSYIIQEGYNFIKMKDEIIDAKIIQHINETMGKIRDSNIENIKQLQNILLLNNQPITKITNSNHFTETDSEYIKDIHIKYLSDTTKNKINESYFMSNELKNNHDTDTDIALYNTDTRNNDTRHNDTSINDTSINDTSNNDYRSSDNLIKNILLNKLYDLNQVDKSYTTNNKIIEINPPILKINQTNNINNINNHEDDQMIKDIDTLDKQNDNHDDNHDNNDQGDQTIKIDILDKNNDDDKINNNIPIVEYPVEQIVLGDNDNISKISNNTHKIKGTLIKEVDLSILNYNNIRMCNEYHVDTLKKIAKYYSIKITNDNSKPLKKEELYAKIKDHLNTINS